jgi:MbtH protein
VTTWLSKSFGQAEEAISQQEEINMGIDDADTIFQVVVNDEDQYSIWFADRALPGGWTAVGHSGTKQECLEYIEKIWTDMRPRSVRERVS